MTQKSWQKVFIGIAVLLLLSFLLHSVFFDHDHPHELFGDGMQALLHGDHKKWWLLLAFVSLFLSVGEKILDARASNGRMRVRCFEYLRRVCRLFDVMHKILRAGILHPKLCA